MHAYVKGPFTSFPHFGNRNLGQLPPAHPRHPVHDRDESLRQHVARAGPGLGLDKSSLPHVAVDSGVARLHASEGSQLGV